MSIRLYVNSAALKILIADDHGIVRRGLKSVLQESRATTEIGEASDGVQAIEMALSHDWDAIILDISMPGANGIKVLKTVKQHKPDLPVLMLSMHSALAYVTGAMKAGASAYLCKEAAADELLTALKAALAGKTYLSRGLQ
jgi:DNA-binding NarL/FixJ family response regulator